MHDQEFHRSKSFSFMIEEDREFRVKIYKSLSKSLNMIATQTTYPKELYHNEGFENIKRNKHTQKQERREMVRSRESSWTLFETSTSDIGLSATQRYKCKPLG